MEVLVYVNDCLFFGPDQTKIDAMITKLQKEQKLTLTVEKEDAYAFLGVDVKPNKEGGYTMTQEGLIHKVLNTVTMDKCGKRATPSEIAPLGSDGNGKPFKASYGYASIIGMLLSKD